MNQQLVDTFRKTSQLSPSLRAVVDWVTKDNKLILDTPIQVAPASDKGVGLYSMSRIRPDKTFLMVSTMKCISGKELLDCPRERASELFLSAETLAKKYHSENIWQQRYNQQMLVMLLQVWVQSREAGLTAHPYAAYLKSLRVGSPLFWGRDILQRTYSLNLQSYIQGLHNYFIQLHKDLRVVGLHGISSSELIELTSSIRSRTLNFSPDDPKRVDTDNVALLCPIVDLANHSFTPNTAIDGFYNATASESFVTLRSLREIAPEEEITINYGDLPNLDLLSRFGFTVPNNNFNTLSIPLNFDEWLEFAGQLFEFKQKVLKQATMTSSLESFTLHPNKMAEEHLAKLRAYLLDEEDVKQRPELTLSLIHI
eukprot:TRINITY_DN13617_c0_g1_i4.p1 TRINITY_DN13617_c0_g1~~TRINITY_DN13617_c0_g1_i4.p1  ORF type:complete len:369 (-),score=60.31 TRINITY_DN13617_c0_g1_i4:61-1167(-)